MAGPTEKTPHILELTDFGQAVKHEDEGGREFAGVVDELNEKFTKGEIPVISLHGKGAYRNSDSEEILAYHHAREKDGREKWTFRTSKYIGDFTADGLEIRIRPRFGANALRHMLSAANNVFIPEADAPLDKEENDNYWLLIMVWRALLDDALARNHIPRAYREERKNLRYFRSRLDVMRHIKTNPADPSRFFCKYRKLTADVTINRAILHVYSLLKQHDSANLLGSFNEYMKKLAALGVEDTTVTTEEIENIKYTRINEIYEPLMNLSKQIIELDWRSSRPDAPSYGPRASFFIDMSELWENYLLKVLQNRLTGYRIYSPNEEEGKTYLINNGYREVRPDIIIEEYGGDKQIILDAKYKSYTTFGAIDDKKYCISREDVHQMVTYLYRYGKNKKTAGIFTSPANACNEWHTPEDHPEHRIGLVNLDLDHAPGNGEDLEKREEAFVKNISEGIAYL